MIRRGIKTVLLSSLLAVFLGACGGSGGGSSTPSVRVSLPAQTGALSPGDSVTLSVDVKNIGATFYAAFDVIYDPAVIQYVEAKEGGFLNKNGTDETLFETSFADGAPGRLAVGLTRLGLSGTASGTGTLMTITFKAVGAGTSAIALSNPKALRDDADDDVEVKFWEDAEITVE